MADVAATPEPGTATPPPTTEAEAVSMIGEAMRRQEQAIDAEERPADRATPPEPPPEEPEPEPEQAGEASDDQEPESEREAQPEETQSETEEVEEVEVPLTLDTLAEHFGVDPADLAGEFTIELLGEDGKVESKMSLAEAIRGNLREADYTRKTQELAEQRRQIETQTQAAQQSLAERLQRADEMLAVMEQQFSGLPNPSPAMLDPSSPEYDPEGYQRLKAQKEFHEAQLNEVREKRQAEIQEQQRQQLAEYNKNRKEQQRLLQTHFPEVKSPDGVSKLEKTIREGLTDGRRWDAFTNEEVDAFFMNYNARQVGLVYDAIKWRNAQKGAKELPKKLKGKPKVIRPGTAPNRKDGTQRAEADALDRLKHGGGKEAAVDLIRAKLRRA